MPKFQWLSLQVYYLSIGTDGRDPNYQERQKNIIALPGLAYNLRRSDYLYFGGSGFTNMASISRLRCSGWIAFDWNYQLTTLDGLQNLRALTGGPGGTDYYVNPRAGGGFSAANGPHFTSASLAAIRAYAACPSGSSSRWTGSIFFANDRCTIEVTSLAGSGGFLSVLMF